MTSSFTMRMELALFGCHPPSRLVSRVRAWTRPVGVLTELEDAQVLDGIDAGSLVLADRRQTGGSIGHGLRSASSSVSASAAALTPQPAVDALPLVPKDAA